MNALADAVAHDVKNRLAILGEELARLRGLSLSPQAQAHVAVASEQATQVTAKLVELLTVQKAVGSGGLRAAVHEELPELFLADVHAAALPLAGGRVELLRRVDNAPSFWFFDQHLVRLALDSALHNALRFAASRITLGCRREGELLCFYVHDDGPGVQTQGCETSTGLGRALCDEVARAHRNGGRQGYSSLRNHHNGGALYELHLP